MTPRIHEAPSVSMNLVAQQRIPETALRAEPGSSQSQKIELPIPWTDCWDTDHESVIGNPVSFHAMRGLAAHSNGFHTIRSLAILMTVLGTIDRPGGFRHKAPFPRPIPPCAKPPKDPDDVMPDTPLGGMPLGWPAEPTLSRTMLATNS